eukprot:scaffold68141_cov15-Tisochrysis_lutea.AAC.1
MAIAPRRVKKLVKELAQETTENHAINAQAHSTIENTHSASEYLLALCAPGCHHIDSTLDILSGCQCSIIHNM